MGAATVYNMDSKYDDTSDIYKMIYNKNNAVHVDHSPWWQVYELTCVPIALNRKPYHSLPNLNQAHLRFRNCVALLKVDETKNLRGQGQSMRAWVI